MVENVFYELIENVSKNTEKYTYFTIKGLKRLFVNKNYKYDYEFNGSACLIKNAYHPGYCNLCIVHSKNCSDEFVNGFTITFAPLYNEKGEMVFVKYPHDTTFCAICSSSDKGEDVEIVFWNNGVFEGF